MWPKRSKKKQRKSFIERMDDWDKNKQNFKPYTDYIDQKKGGYYDDLFHEDQIDYKERRGNEYFFNQLSKEVIKKNKEKVKSKVESGEAIILYPNDSFFGVKKIFYNLVGKEIVEGHKSSQSIFRTETLLKMEEKFEKERTLNFKFRGGNFKIITKPTTWKGAQVNKLKKVWYAITNNSYIEFKELTKSDLSRLATSKHDSGILQFTPFYH